MRPGTNQAKELKVRLDSQPGGARRTVGRKDEDCRLATPFRAQAESCVGIRSTELRRQRKRGKRRIRNGNMMPVRPTLVAGGRAGAGAIGSMATAWAECTGCASGNAGAVAWGKALAIATQHPPTRSSAKIQTRVLSPGNFDAQFFRKALPDFLR